MLGHSEFVFKLLTRLDRNYKNLIVDFELFFLDPYIYPNGKHWRESQGDSREDINVQSYILTNGRRAART